MKHLLTLSFILIFSSSVFSQSPLVAVNDSATASLGELITINVTANDYHTEGLPFRILYAQDSYSFTDSTITYYFDYDKFYNENGSIEFTYNLIDENGLWYITGIVIIDLSNNYSDTLDVNNIKALIHPYATQFWNGRNPSNAYLYEYPKESGKNTIYSSEFWIGGIDQNNQLKVSADHWRFNEFDFWTGPLSQEDNNLSIDTSTVINWNRVWKLSKSEVEYHILHWNNAGYQAIENIANWPAHGDASLNQSSSLAPFIDENNNEVYEPLLGDYPLIKGDQCIFFIFNDLRDVNTSTGGDPIGLEIHAMMYQFSEPNQPAINNTVFLNYKIFNRSSNVLNDAFIGVWTDLVIGKGYDDYLGCDVERGFYYGYNGEETDGNGEPDSYGENPPAQGIVFLAGPLMDPNELDDPNGGCDESINGVGFGDTIIDNERYGMTSFLYHINDNSALGEPQIDQDYYYYIKGTWRDGENMLYGGDAYDYEVVGPECKFMFPGDSDSCNWGTNQIIPNGGYNQNGFYWSEETTLNGTPFPPGDRRGVGGTGPFTFLPNSMQTIDIAYVTARGDHGPISSVDLLKTYVDTIRARFIMNPNDFGNQYLAVEENNSEISNLKIYPNPANDMVFVEYENKSPHTKCNIYDLYGRLVYSQSVGISKHFSIDLKTFKDGVYLISIVDEKQRHSAKLIIE